MESTLSPRFARSPLSVAGTRTGRAPFDFAQDRLRPAPTWRGQPAGAGSGEGTLRVTAGDLTHGDPHLHLPWTQDPQMDSATSRASYQTKSIIYSTLQPIMYTHLRGFINHFGVSRAECCRKVCIQNLYGRRRRRRDRSRCKVQADCILCPTFGAVRVLPAGPGGRLSPAKG